MSEVIDGNVLGVSDVPGSTAISQPSQSTPQQPTSVEEMSEIARNVQEDLAQCGITNPERLPKTRQFKVQTELGIEDAVDVRIILGEPVPGKFETMHVTAKSGFYSISVRTYSEAIRFFTSFAKHKKTRTGFKKALRFWKETWDV